MVDVIPFFPSDVVKKPTKKENSFASWEGLDLVMGIKLRCWGNYDPSSYMGKGIESNPSITPLKRYSSSVKKHLLLEDVDG